MSDSKNSTLWFWLSWLAVAATFAVFAAASFMPENRLWGLNHLAFHTQPVRLGILIVSGLLLVPPLATATWRGLLWITHPYFRGLQSGINAIALSGVVTFVTFAAYRASTKLLGDGYYILNNFRNAAENELGISGYFDVVTTHERIYPATELLNFAASLAAGRFGASPSGGIWLLNCAVGAAIVVAALAAVRRLDWPDGAKLTVLALALFTGAIQLFFGYIEHYTLAIGLGAIYVFTAARAATGQTQMWKPGVLLLAGTLLHVQTLLLLPSYLWLVVWISVFKRAPLRAGPTAAGTAILALAAAAGLRFVPAAGAFFLPLIGPDGGYGVFSGAHLLDVINQVLLLCPMWLLFAVLILRDRITRGPGDGADRSVLPALSWTLAVPAVLFLLLFKPELGMARDWDLFCFAVFGLSTPGLAILIQHISRGAPSRRSAAIAAPAVILAAAMVFSWVGVNADPERSVARYRAILGYDLTNPGYAFESLARHFEDNFQYTRQINALHAAYESSHNPRFLHKLARVYVENGDMAGALKSLRLYLAVRPDDDDARLLLLPLLARQDLVEEMIHESLLGIQYSPRKPEYHFFLGNAYLAKGMTEEGLKAFETCSRLDPPAAMVQEMKRQTDQAGRNRPNSN